MKRKLITRVVLCLLGGFVFAPAVPAERLPVKIYTSADGLGSSFIDYLMRDSRGFMWFCTRDGLSRFDGSRFITYSIGDKDAPPGIEGITETRGGVYWLTTTGGLYRFKADAASHPNQTIGGRPLLNAEFITKSRGSILEDRAGNLWYLANDLYRVHEQSGKVEFQEARLNLPVNPNRPQATYEMREADDGCFWISTDSGLVRRLPDGRIILYQHETKSRLGLVSMIADRGGRIWVVWGNDLFVIKPPPLESLPVFDRFTTQRLTPTSISSIEGDRAIVFPEKPGEVLRLTGLPVSAPVKRFYQTTDGHIWLTASDTLGEFDGRLFHAHGTAEGLPIGMDTMCDDATGNLWIAGRTGLARLDRRGLTSYGKADGMNSDNVEVINEGADGTLYFANGDFYLSRFHGKQFQSVRPQVAKEARARWNSRYAFLSSANEWWILTAQKVYRFAASNLRRPLATYDSQMGLRADDAFQVFEDSRGDIWLSQRPPNPENNDLCRLKRGENVFYSFSEGEGLPAGNAAESFAEDKQGNLWFGFYDGGLVRFANNRFTELTAADGLPSGVITDLLVDRKGRLWLTSSFGGVRRIDNPGAAKPTFVSFTTDQGLSSNNTRTITEDKLGNVYVGTVRGVDRISPETNRVKHYSVSDGLAGDFVVDSHCDRSGILWFATTNGLSRLVPTADEDYAPPTVWLGGLRIAGEEQAVSELGDAEIQKGDLSYTRNNLQIDFFGLDFRAGETLRYQFMLAGADSNWSAPTEQRTVTYANLQPGRYRFLVRAVNADGIASARPAIFSFRILPPIWLRWWFLVLATFMALAILYLLYRYRMARLREVNAALGDAKRAEENLGKAREERLAELERVRKRIASDLHDEIGSSLTQISLLSEVVQQRIDGEDLTVTAPLATIATSSRELVDSMSDIVWAINPKKDHLSDLVQRMRGLASEVFTACDVKFRFQAPAANHNLPLGANLRREVFLTYKESINNIVKHSCCTEADVELRLDADRLVLKVSDNGKGFEAAQESEGHGLISMRDRAQQMGGTLEMMSAAGQGTTIVLQVPFRDVSSDFGFVARKSKTKQPGRLNRKAPTKVRSEKSEPSA